MKDTLCINCGKPIQSSGWRKDVWYHVKGTKVYCRKGFYKPRTKAEPQEQLK